MLVNYYRRSLSMMTDCLRPKLIARFVHPRYIKKHDCHCVTFRVRIDSSATRLPPNLTSQGVTCLRKTTKQSLLSKNPPTVINSHSQTAIHWNERNYFSYIRSYDLFIVVLSFITFFRSIITVSSFHQTSWFQNVWGVSRVRGCHTKLNCSIAKTTEL